MSTQIVMRALFLLLHCVPAVIGIPYGANPAWVPTSLLLGLLLLVSLDATDSRAARVAIALSSGLLVGAGVLLAASYYLQGEAFNARFFFHFDLGSLRIALAEFRAQTFAGLLLIGLASALPAVLERRDRRWRASWALAAGWLFALALHHPVYAFIKYVAADTQAAVPTTSANRDAPGARAESALADATPAPARPKNLILIYAESLERTFLDRAAFGDLMPGIAALEASALTFTNLVQLGGTGWTISGIVASQCGFPLLQSTLLASNSSMASAERPFAGHDCLGDILAARGYRNVFLGGAPLWFGGKGKFLAAHGYHEIYGRDELSPLLDDPDYLSGWGLYDDSLFEIGLEKVAELEAGDRPYFLTLLTVDTHHPNGNPSRGCRPLQDNPDRISNAIFCSDQLITSFIDRVRAMVDPARTVIALFSDHLAMRNTLFDKLQAMRDARRLLLLLFRDGLDGEIDAEGNHFDVAPTLLAAAGIGGYGSLNLGSNLLAANAGTRSPRPVAAAAPSLFGPDQNLRAGGVLIGAEDLSIQVGELTVRANAEGAEFADGLFLAVFDDDGDLVDTVYSKNFNTVLAELKDRFVVGFSRFAEAPEDVSYFYGRLTERGENFVIAPLRAPVRLEPAALAAADAWGSATGEG